jgi:hypothetical protein
MFDNLREEVSSKPFLDDEEEAKFQPAAGTEPAKRSSTRLLGMTPVQRFVIVFMLFLTVCVIGTLFLFVMEKITL